jgi:hypothetical protein
MTEEYSGKERRRKCVECVSHREHATQIQYLQTTVGEIKGEMRESVKDIKAELHSGGKTMWDSIKAKVPYIHFISGLTIVMTAIGIVTGVNWTTMVRVLDSNHRVELQITALQGEFKSIDKRLLSIERQQADFRQKFLQIRREISGTSDFHFETKKQYMENNK